MYNERLRNRFDNFVSLWSLPTRVNPIKALGCSDKSSGINWQRALTTKQTSATPIIDTRRRRRQRTLFELRVRGEEYSFTLILWLFACLLLLFDWAISTREAAGRNGNIHKRFSDAANLRLEWDSHENLCRSVSPISKDVCRHDRGLPRPPYLQTKHIATRWQNRHVRGGGRDQSGRPYETSLCRNDVVQMDRRML
jgi:hypothetical protein